MKNTLAYFGQRGRKKYVIRGERDSGVRTIKLFLIYHLFPNILLLSHSGLTVLKTYFRTKVSWSVRQSHFHPSLILAAMARSLTPRKPIAVQ